MVLNKEQEDYKTMPSKGLMHTIENRESDRETLGSIGLREVELCWEVQYKNRQLTV
jgi:hypothetical protein